MSEIIHAKECQCPECWQGGLPFRQAAGRGIASGIIGAVLIFLGIIVAAFLIKWGLTEYYITTHCTTVLGTRVCQ